MTAVIKKKIIIGFFTVLYLVFLVLKIFIMLSNSEFVDYNARNASRIENIINLKQKYSFLAVGNIRNSKGIFDKKLVPLINSSKADFVVLLGDSVLDGANDKYAFLYRSLLKLNKPVLCTIGDSEISDGGLKNYFKHIGSPYFFFISGNSEFIFLDSTGHTEEAYQINWLKGLLGNVRNVSTRFVFINRSLVLNNEDKENVESGYTMGEEYKKQLMDIFIRTQVSAVISSSSGVFDQRTAGGVLYIASGGGGGSLTYRDGAVPYYCTLINVDGNGIAVSLVKPERMNLTGELTFFDLIWDKIYSIVYLYFINGILVISLLFLAVYITYSRLVERIDYYPDLNKIIEHGYPLKIAMFTNNYLPFIGGVPLSILRLKQGLEKKGHKVFVFAPNYGDYKEKEAGVFRCAPLFHYRKGDLIVPVSNIFSSRIRKEFKNINPDIVHVHHPFWLGSVGRRLARKYSKPVVFTYHTRIEQYNHYVPVFKDLAGGQIPHMIIKKFASGCDAVVAPTGTAKQYLRNLGIGRQVIVQPTGIDLSAFRMMAHAGKEIIAEKGEKILFSVFRLSKEKNPYFLIDGLAELKSRTSVPFKCFIAGTGPEEKNMDNYIKGKGLEGLVVLLGKISPQDMPAYYNTADLFVFSSMSETQGMVILEAMAGGCPVVAVDSSGISDIIENGVNGYKTSHSPEQWVDRIKYLLEHEEVMEKFSRNAVVTAENNSVDVMTANILDMYYKVIDWKKKHPYQPFIR